MLSADVLSRPPSTAVGATTSARPKLSTARAAATRPSLTPTEASGAVAFRGDVPGIAWQENSSSRSSDCLEPDSTLHRGPGITTQAGLTLPSKYTQYELPAGSSLLTPPRKQLLLRQAAAPASAALTVMVPPLLLAAPRCWSQHPAPACCTAATLMCRRQPLLPPHQAACGSTAEHVLVSGADRRPTPPNPQPVAAAGASPAQHNDVAPSTQHRAGGNIP